MFQLQIIIINYEVVIFYYAVNKLPYTQPLMIYVGFIKRIRQVFALFFVKKREAITIRNGRDLGI